MAIGKNTFTGGLVQLYVGESEELFEAHIELMCKKSKFFHNALKGRFEEAENKVIKLPEDEPDTFTELLSWVYVNELPMEFQSPSYMKLGKLWVMADKYDIPSLQNKVIDLIATKWKTKIFGARGNLPPKTIEYVYNNTMPNGKLRAIILDICVCGMEADKFETYKSAFPKEFLEEFALAHMKRINKLIISNPKVNVTAVMQPISDKVESYYVAYEPTKRTIAPAMADIATSTSTKQFGSASNTGM